MKVRHIQFVFLNPHSLLLIDCHNSLSLPATKKWFNSTNKYTKYLLREKSNR